MMCEITNNIEISQMCNTILLSVGNDTSLLKDALVTIIKLLLLSRGKNLYVFLLTTTHILVYPGSFRQDFHQAKVHRNCPNHRGASNLSSQIKTWQSSKNLINKISPIITIHYFDFNPSWSSCIFGGYLHTDSCWWKILLFTNFRF